MNCALPTSYSGHGLSKRWAKNMDLRTGKIFFQFIYMIITKMAKIEYEFIFSKVS